MTLASLLGAPMICLIFLQAAQAVHAGDRASGNPDNAVKVTELLFNAARSARVQGRLVGPAKHEYTFDARKGQIVELALSSDLSPWIGIDLLAPVFVASLEAPPQGAAPVYTNFIDGTTRWQGAVPGNGTYTVRLGLMSSQARRIGRVDYELDVNLK